MDTTILRRIYPTHMPCPACAHDKHTSAGQSASGLLKWCRCKRCGHKFKVSPIGEEYLTPGAATSRLRLY